MFLVDKVMQLSIKLKNHGSPKRLFLKAKSIGYVQNNGRICGGMTLKGSSALRHPMHLVVHGAC